MSIVELKDCPDLTALTAQVNELKEKVDHLATLTGQCGCTCQSDDSGTLTALTAQFKALKTGLTIVKLSIIELDWRITQWAKARLPWIYL